jgi:hypothetical protein
MAIITAACGRNWHIGYSGNTLFDAIPAKRGTSRPPRGLGCRPRIQRSSW